MLLAVATVALAAALWLTLRSPEASGPYALVIAAALWLAVDQPVEGPVLARVSSGHGVHLADILIVGLVALAMAARSRLVGAPAGRHRPVRDVSPGC